MSAEDKLLADKVRTAVIELNRAVVLASHGGLTIKLSHQALELLEIEDDVPQLEVSIFRRV